MKLLEYEAKQLLKSAGVAIPDSVLVHPGESAPLFHPVVLKSQVPVGGRGKAGGIAILESGENVKDAIDRLFKRDIKGYLPTTLLAEEKLAIHRELYLSIVVDRSTQGTTLIANRNGGVDVEEKLGVSFLHIPIPLNPDFESLGQDLADYYDKPDQTFALQDLVEKLYTCLVKNDALLIEINPLVITKHGQLIAGDCKMTLDDAAAYRHEWNFEEKIAEANFVTLDPRGNIATIANGAGLAMATVDAASSYGLKPANFLDIGGGANSETLLVAFQRLSEYPDLKAIVINIFAGITRCDEVARAIIIARSKITNLPPLFIRLAGTGYNEALPLLQAARIPLLSSLEECLEAAKHTVSKDEDWA